MTSRVASQLPLLPALAAAFLPKCPVCLGAYAGVLGALGVQLVPLTTIWPMTWALLGLGLGFIAYRSIRRRRMLPLALATVAVGALVAGRVGHERPALAVAGLALFFVASLWNARPRAAG